MDPKANIREQGTLLRKTQPDDVERLKELQEALRAWRDRGGAPPPGGWEKAHRYLILPKHLRRSPTTVETRSMERQLKVYAVPAPVVCSGARRWTYEADRVTLVMAGRVQQAIAKLMEGAFRMRTAIEEEGFGREYARDALGPTLQLVKDGKKIHQALENFVRFLEKDEATSPREIQRRVDKASKYAENFVGRADKILLLNQDLFGIRRF